MDTIRHAIAALLKDYKVGLLAKKMGDLNISTLYKWGEPSTENDRHGEIPLRRAIQLTLITGDTRLMAAISEEAGGTFMPGHNFVAGKYESDKVALKVMKESADLIKEYISALEDGKVTRAEYAKLEREAMKLHLATAAVIESAKQRGSL